MSDPFAGEGDESSLFHQGMLKMRRLDRLHVNLHKCRLTRNYVLWGDFLRAWRQEMVQLMNPEEFDEYHRYESDMNIALADYRKVLQGMKSRSKYPVYDILDMYGNFLARVESRVGFDTAKKGLGFEGAGVV